MKRAIILILAFALLISTLAGCAPRKTYEKLSSGEEIQMFLIHPTKKDVDDFEKRCGELLPDTYLGDVFNVTPREFAGQYDFQIFREDHNNACFLLYDGAIFPMGYGWGSTGVSSFALADVDADGNNELYFASAWGSCLIRSMIYWFDFGTETGGSFDLSSFTDALAVGIDSKGTIVVCTASISGAVYISKLQDKQGITLEKKVATVTFQSDQFVLVYCDQEWYENCNFFENARSDSESS